MGRWSANAKAPAQQTARGAGELLRRSLAVQEFGCAGVWLCRTWSAASYGSAADGLSLGQNHHVIDEQRGRGIVLACEGDHIDKSVTGLNG